MTLVGCTDTRAFQVRAHVAQPSVSVRIPGRVPMGSTGARGARLTCSSGRRETINAMAFNDSTEALQSEEGMVGLALRLWREEQDFSSAEEMFKRALEMVPRSQRVRSKTLGLFSQFLRSTPPTNFQAYQSIKDLCNDTD